MPLRDQDKRQNFARVELPSLPPEAQQYGLSLSNRLYTDQRERLAGSKDPVSAAKSHQKSMLKMLIDFL